MRILAKLKRLQAMKTQADEIREQRVKQTAREAPVDPSSVFVPHAGPQTQFWKSECREVLYGGQAGGGKSASIIALPLKWARLPGFLALTLRRESTQSEDLARKSRELYPRAFPGLAPVKSPRYRWDFPSGASNVFGHCKNEDDFAQYDGWEINLLCFDEITHFTEQQYKYICARVRTAHQGYPTFIRATTNPGGVGHAWVFRHWGAWLDPEFEAEGLPSKGERPPGPPAKPGEVWWIRTLEDGREVYYRDEPPGEPGLPRALSRTFIPARLEDNPTLAKNDPAYAAELNKLDPVRRAQLRDGNWLVKPAAGLYFKRSWCLVVEPSDIPQDAEFCRYWDRASTDESAGGDPDYTAGVLMAHHGNLYWIVHAIWKRLSPGKVDDLITTTAELDCADWGAVMVASSQDPGQAGVDQARRFVASMDGHRVAARRETGDKVVRFGPFSSQAEHGNVRVVRGAWNEGYFGFLEAFPTPGEHDDPVDATSGAHKELSMGTSYSSATSTRRSREV